MPEARQKSDPKVATEVELVYAITEKDEGALLELRKRHSSLVRGIIGSVLSKGCTDPIDHGKDAEQETWKRVWKHAERFDERKGPFEAWLTTIAKRRALTDLVRCLKRREKEVQLEEESTAGKADWAATYDLPKVIESLELVDNVLQDLSEEYRTIVKLCLFDGIPQGEVSGQLGVSVSKIKVVIHRFRKSLKGAQRERQRER